MKVTITQLFVRRLPLSILVYERSIPARNVVRLGRGAEETLGDWCRVRNEEQHRYSAQVTRAKERCQAWRRNLMRFKYIAQYLKVRSMGCLFTCAVN